MTEGPYRARRGGFDDEEQPVVPAPQPAQSWVDAPPPDAALRDTSPVGEQAPYGAVDQAPMSMDTLPVVPEPPVVAESPVIPDSSEGVEPQFVAPQPPDAEPVPQEPVPAPVDQGRRVVSTNPLLAGAHTSAFGVLRSEWIKLWSLPSTWWVIGATLVASVLLGLLMGFSARMVHNQPAGVEGMPVGMTFYASDAAGIMVFVQLVLSILAVLCITNEYGSGQIRATLTAAPGRISTLLSKATIIAAVSAVVTFIGGYAAILVGWPFMSGFAVDDRFVWDGVRIVLGATLATMLVSIFALAVGFLLRNTAAGIGIVVGLLFVLPIILNFVQVHWVGTVHQYLIDACQVGLYPARDRNVGGTSSGFDFVKSLWVTALWAVVPLLAAGVVLKRRDA